MPPSLDPEVVMHRLLISLLLLLLAAPSGAAVELRWEPADQTVSVGGTGFLSVMVDDVIDIRTVELTVQYDPAILTSLSGSPGQLFNDAGCSLFPDFQDDTPGQWYGACVALGFDCWLTGPGELYRWEFEGTNPGFSHIDVIQVRLYDPDANVIEDVTLPGTLVFVGEGTEVPPAEDRGDLGLELYPNPFNPRVRLAIRAAEELEARLTVYDLSGRAVAQPWAGQLSASTTDLIWTGQDETGRALPSGIYLFHLDSSTGQSLTRRGILLK